MGTTMAAEGGPASVSAWGPAAGSSGVAQAGAAWAGVQTEAEKTPVASRLAILRIRAPGETCRYTVTTLDEVDCLLRCGKGSMSDCFEVEWDTEQQRFTLSQEAIAEAACALANTFTGGILLFGVKERSHPWTSCEVVGIDQEKLEPFLQHINQALSDVAQPPIVKHKVTTLQWRPTVVSKWQRQQQQDNFPWLVAVDIPPAAVHTRHISDGDTPIVDSESLTLHAVGGKVIRRVGDAAIQLTDAAASDYLQALGSMLCISGEERPVQYADVNRFLSMSKLRRLGFTYPGWQPTPGCVLDLRRMKMAGLVRDAGKAVLTVAGLLVAGVDEWQDRLGDGVSFTIQIQHRDGDDPATEDIFGHVEGWEFTGDAMSMVKEATSKITALSESAYEKLNLTDGDGRTMVRNIRFQAFPEEAVSELLMNAMVHRSYLNPYSRIVVHVYRRCLKIISPGGLLRGQRVDNLETLGSIPRNRDLAWNLSEGRGCGLSKARSIIEEAGGTMSVAVDGSEVTECVIVTLGATPSRCKARGAASQA